MLSYEGHIATLCAFLHVSFTPCDGEPDFKAAVVSLTDENRMPIAGEYVALSMTMFFALLGNDAQELYEEQITLLQNNRLGDAQ